MKTSHSNPSEVSWNPSAILMRSIKSFYPIYTQLNLPEPLKSDLREATLKLVEGYFYTTAVGFVGMDDDNKKLKGGQAAMAVHMVVLKACEGKGYDYAEKFQKEVTEIEKRVLPLNPQLTEKVEPTTKPNNPFYIPITNTGI